MADSVAGAGPRDAAVMEAILKEMGVEEYDPNVVQQMLEFSYRYVCNVLEDAHVYSEHAQKKELDVSDVKLAVHTRMDHSFTTPPPRDFLIEVARKKNSTPLPLIPEKFGPQLPPERYCLTANNFRLKDRQKPPTLAKPQVTLAATFRLPVGGAVNTVTAVRAQLSSPLLQSTTATIPSNMPSLSGLTGSPSEILSLSLPPSSSSSSSSAVAVPRQNMSGVSPLGVARAAATLTGSNSNTNNSAIRDLIMSIPALGKLD